MGIFTGKVAIITGGGKAKSIGYGVATAYAKEGANLAITGRNEQKLLDAKEELERLYGIKVLPIVADDGPSSLSKRVWQYLHDLHTNDLHRASSQALPSEQQGRLHRPVRSQKAGGYAGGTAQRCRFRVDV